MALKAKKLTVTIAIVRTHLRYTKHHLPYEITHMTFNSGTSNPTRDRILL